MTNTPETPSAGIDLCDFDPMALVTEAEWLKYQHKVVAIDELKGGIAVASDGSPIVADSYPQIFAMIDGENAKLKQPMRLSIIAVPAQGDFDKLAEQRREQVAEFIRAMS